MNLVFLFLTRADLNAIPRIGLWLSEQPGPHNFVAFINPHLAIDPSEEQVSLENQILDSIGAPLISDQQRMNLEMTLQKRWMQIPRQVLVDQLNLLFSPTGVSTKNGLVILSESFQCDRLSELLTKLRPAWPKNIPLGKFILVMPNQIPVMATREVGRPKGKVQDPEKLAKLRAGMAAARAKKAEKKAAETAAV